MGTSVGIVSYSAEGRTGPSGRHNQVKDILFSVI